ncbi:MAG: D-sedoheptulose 7-phosphate isomerase [Patescibacteria group bacterium]
MIKKHLQNSSDLKTVIASDSELVSGIEKMGLMMIETLQAGGKILVAGNGGSATQSQHFAAELVGRYERDSAPQAAVSLVSDIACLTALSNDFGFEEVFAKQVEGLGKDGDVFLGISTSGNSKNVNRALEAAKSQGMKCLGLCGKDGGSMKDLCDEVFIVPSDKTPLIQESHISILHIWADLIEQSL